MTEQIAFLVDDLGPSQQSFFLIQALNKWLQGSTENDAAVFCRTSRPPCSSPAFPVFSLADFPGYPGVAVATNWACADFLLATQGPKKRAIYVQDLEWSRRPGAYEDWYRVYGDPSLHMLCRGPSHADVLSKAWNRAVNFVPYFDVNEILEEVCRRG